MSDRATINGPPWILTKPAVNTIRRIPPLPNRPHDQRLTAPRVSSGEDSGHAGSMGFISRDVPTTIEIDGEIG